MGKYLLPRFLTNAIDAIKIKLKELGMKNKDWVRKAGSKSYFSAFLNRSQPLTFELARLFHLELGIPAEVFLSWKMFSAGNPIIIWETH